MKQVQIPESLLYDLFAYFILERKDEGTEKKITETLENKVGRMARRQEYAQKIAAGKH